jgi:hypothetical protein
MSGGADDKICFDLEALPLSASLVISEGGFGDTEDVVLPIVLFTLALFISFTDLLFLGSNGDLARLFTLTFALGGLFMR